MSLNITDEPWSFLDEGIPVAAGDSVTVGGAGSPRAVCALSSKPWYKRRNNYLPACSFPFIWGSEIKQSYCLPTNSKPKDEDEISFVMKVGVGSDSVEIVQENLIGRFTNDESPEGSKSFSVTTWINWLINSYQELAHSEDVTESEIVFAGLARREWPSTTRQFLQEGADQALMSLIVRLAADRALSTTLQALSDNPRKVLSRIREELPLSRIQQLDSACIRDFARRPGHTAAEKAGPRQKLLGLNRIEDTNTLENRVTAWVLEELQKKSKTYSLENAMHSDSPRVRSVRRLGFNSRNWRFSEYFQQVKLGSLHHPVMPNYPLQLERRYKKIYEVYKQLLLDEKVHDDAWEWQRNLWACAARSILYARLTARFKERFSSFSFIRSESHQGQWVEPPVAPGPLKAHDKLYYIFDSADVNASEWLNQQEIFPGAHEIGMTGCDLALYCQKTNEVIFVWLYYWTGSKGGFFQRQQSCLEVIKKIENTIHKRTPKQFENVSDSEYQTYRKNRKSVSYKGIVLGSLLEESTTEDSVKLEMDAYPMNEATKLVSILLPYRSYSEMDDFDAALDLVLGENS